MVLAGDVALGGAASDDGVVVGPVSVGEFVGFASCGYSEELVSEADAEDGFSYLNGFLDVLDCGLALLWVTWAVGEHESVVVDLVEVVVPRYSYDSDVAFEEASDDVELGSGVDHYDFVFAVAVGLYLRG